MLIWQSELVAGIPHPVAVVRVRGTVGGKISALRGRCEVTLMRKATNGGLWFALLIAGYIFLFCSSLAAEDVKLREEAIRLMEKANQVSLLGALSSYRMETTFRVHYADGTTREGSYSRVLATSVGMREEERFGDFHAVYVHMKDKWAYTSLWKEPVELLELREQLPVRLGRFDQEDVIRSIDDASVDGVAAKCIRFDTQFGDKLQANEICMDPATGAELRWRVGDELVENFSYFQVGNLWEPAHIVRSVRGALQMEIDQKITLLQGAVDPNLFASPTGTWYPVWHCDTFRRPIGISTPQPPPGNAGTDTVDVVISGYIRENGKPQTLSILSSSRADLNDEALKTVAGWTFQPMLCNGNPGTQRVEFVVHFQGR